MLEDLQAEATRIRAGRPTPSGCRGADDEFGFEGAGRDGSGGSSAARSPAVADGSALTMDRWRFAVPPLHRHHTHPHPFNGCTSQVCM